MRRFETTITLLAAALAAAMGASAAVAQEIRPVVTLGVFGGGGAFSDLQRQDLRLIHPTSGIVRLDDQTVAAHPGAAVGAHLTYWRGSWGLRLQGGYGNTRVDVQRAGSAGEDGPSGDGAAVDLWNYDLAIAFRLPLSLRVARPYAVVGGGGIEYRLKPGDDAAGPMWLFGGETKKTHMAGLVGVGAEVPLASRGFALAFEVDNHFSRTPVAAREGTWSDGEGSESTPSSDRTDLPSTTRRVNFVNQVRVKVGLTYGVGGGG